MRAPMRRAAHRHPPGVAVTAREVDSVHFTIRCAWPHAPRAGFGVRRCREAFVLAVALAALAGSAPAARALTLADVLREVDGANPMLTARRGMAAAAHQRVAPAGAWDDPMLEVGVLNLPSSGRFDMDPMTMRMIGVQQRVPVAGANALRRRSASAAAVAEDAVRDAARWETLALAWETYADAYYAGERAEGAAAHAGEMDQLVAAARARYTAGGGRLDEVLRVEAEHARTHAELAGFEAEATDARARLAALMGREPFAAATDTLAPPPFAALPADPAAWLAAIVADHPRLRELRAQADRYRFAASAARRMSWPDLQLSASYGLRGSVMGVAQDNMWSGTIGVMLPVFAGQRERAMGAEMDAMALASAAELRAATLELQQRLRSAHASALAGQREVGLLADTVLVVQRRAVEAAWSSYAAGTTDLARVFDVMHQLYSDTITLARARQDLARAEASLLAITANGEPLGLALAAPPRSIR